ncbi:coproporphyrinogen III oxidase [Defluviimonas sp. 20V17]|uniref:Coproporphyrinogen-III oxidase n=1 Tax=Allgaiera indica TaxID=765699 RepID=A0AAN4UTV9_9RHOB|nr:oxygen-independent coproporphyrinogen III oxidase [Allgaiera indica]KDB05330.1 coproporphyrinogen III oxidase [Defluviimonas sp. 20V17]GHE04863.1 oxygen-independent coproporphyrinogen III oxidase [Allgaiera indica]SDX52266.1 oxygen-independent coproporphyrinogen-3 oxidase [Allgaiera indica]
MDSESQLSRLGLFDAQVPRYTSYPTAPHFSGDVDAGVFEAWLREIPAGASISLYVHIPFCRRLCWFCACRTQGTSSLEPVQRYLQGLKAEIALLKERLAPGVRLSRLHWGGGTPTLLSAAMIADLAGAIFDAVPMKEDAEFSVEIDPNELDSARLEALRAAGLNRASIGVQDFDPEIQTVIGRLQSYEVTRDAVDAIRATGVGSLNADILYGLPHQTQARIAETVQKLLSLSPDRVALYGYAHVPWMARRQVMIPSEAMPRPEERLALFESAHALFAWDGYRAIGIDHFARPGDSLARAQAEGRLRRNFQGYTDDTAEILVGLGASSISRFSQGYAQNASATADYLRAVDAGQFATRRGHVLGGDDRLRGRIIEALMCDFHVSSDELVARFGLAPAELAAMFEAVEKAFPGMLDVSAEGLEIPQRARPLTRMIARRFDAYDLSRAGHSSAI